MDGTLLLMPVLLHFFLWIPVLHAGCPYKECFCSGTMILCQSRQLTLMPELVGINLTGFTYLNMNNNSITALPSKRLPHGLQELDLQNNPIVIIDDTAFDGSTNTLQSLELSYATFKKIPNAIGNLKSLTYIHLSYSNITDWNEEVMKNVGSTLTNLELENVGLRAWPTWLQYFPYLKQLTIADNYISSIPDDGFDAMADNLTTLSLSDNLLTMVPKALYKLNNLLTLSLNQNQIYDVSWLPQSSKLTSLSLSDNHITDAKLLSMVLRPYAKYLESLGVDKNLLSSIPDFSFLSQVGDLDLSFNRLSDPFSGYAQDKLSSLVLAHNLFQSVPTIFARLLSVGYITLSWNSITVIQATDFHPQTTYVDLGHNLITELTDPSFPVNSSIIFLYLNNNPLTRISEGALRNLPNLFELNLEYTKITRLPLGLRFLIKLGTIDVGNIAGLVCTCLEKDLTAWIQSITMTDHVIGDCGQTSVYNFFTNLSSSCP